MNCTEVNHQKFLVGYLRSIGAKHLTLARWILPLQSPQELVVDNSSEPRIVNTGQWRLCPKNHRRPFFRAEISFTEIK